MKLLESNIVTSKVLINKKEYEILLDFFGDDDSEQLAEEYNANDDGASLCIVIDEEREIYYEIIAHRYSFENFLHHECFIKYEGIGYNDNLIGLHNYIGEYAYELSIANWSEDDDATTNRIEKVYDMIIDRAQGVEHQGVNILLDAIRLSRGELFRDFKINKTEELIVDYPEDKPALSTYYSIEIGNNTYELLRDMFREKIALKKIEKELEHVCKSVDYRYEGVTLRMFDDSYMTINIDKRNQKYRLRMAKAESYEYCQYYDMKYNTYILPEKETLVDIIEALKCKSSQGCPAHYEHIYDMLIHVINRDI